MVDPLTIESSRSAGKLTFSDPKPPGMKYPVAYLRVSLKAKEIGDSSVRVYLYQPDSLAAFFEDIAANCQDSAAVQQWSSIEGDFALSGKSDGHGHLALEVTLKSDASADNWRVKAIIHIEAGRLEAIAAQVKRFLHV